MPLYGCAAPGMYNFGLSDRLSRRIPLPFQSGFGPGDILIPELVQSYYMPRMGALQEQRYEKTAKNAPLCLPLRKTIIWL